MKPFARVEYVGLFGRWMVLSNGDTRFGDFEKEGEAILIAQNINAAHRAAVKKEKELEVLQKLTTSKTKKLVDKLSGPETRKRGVGRECRTTSSPSQRMGRTDYILNLKPKKGESRKSSRR